MDAGLVLHSGLVYDLTSSSLIYGDRVTRLVCVELSDATTDGVDIVVVLEGGLNGKCMYAGVFAKGPVDIEGSQVTSEGNGANPNDGENGHAQSASKFVEADKGYFQRQFRGHIAVVEGRVAPGKEDPLARQVSSFQVCLHYAIALEEVLYVLYQGDDTDALGKELADPSL